LGIVNKTGKMNKQEVKNYATEMLNKIWTVDGVKYNLSLEGWAFGFHNSKRALGKCWRNTRQITISSFLLGDMTYEILDNTLKHEIAHAIDYAMRGTSDHSWAWKRVARQVGCDAERTAEVKNKPKSKYTLRCPNGHETVAHRRPKVSKSCGKCNPHRYDERYQFQVIQNY